MLLDSSDEEDSFEKEMNEYMQVQGGDQGEGFDVFERKLRPNIRSNKQKQDQKEISAKKSNNLRELESSGLQFCCSGLWFRQHFGYLLTGKHDWV